MSSTNSWTSVTSNVTMSTTNTTDATDVLIYGCFNNFNTIACVRCAILTFLAVLTAVLCVVKVIRLHQACHQNWHQYFIFYCASLECVLAGVHWVLSLYVEIDFVLQWLKLIQFLVMCHFYWTLATRALRREIWTKRFLVPFLVLAGAYFTITAILGIVRVKDTFVECFQPYWLMMSSAEFIIVQLFCVAGFYITRRLNEISTLDSVRRSQKRDLWCIVVVFEISALIGVIYDLSLRIVGDRESGCSAVFKYTQELFSAIFLLFMVAKLLAPIWVMLFVFQPTPQLPVENDDLIPALSDDGNSAFSTNTDEQYRQLYHPTEDYRTLNYDTPTSRSPASNHSVSPTTNGNLYGPGITTGAGNQQNNKVSQSNLGTIREEANFRQPTPPQQSLQGGGSSLTRQQRTTPPRGAGPATTPGDKEKDKPTEQCQNQRSSGEGSGQARNIQSETLGNRREVLPGNQVIPSNTENVPKFSIQGNETDNSPPSPRGKFYI